MSRATCLGNNVLSLVNVRRRALVASRGINTSLLAEWSYHAARGFARLPPRAKSLFLSWTVHGMAGGRQLRGRRREVDGHSISVWATSSRRGSGVIQRGQHFAGMALWIHFRPDPNDATICPNQETGPQDPPVGLAVVGLLAPGPVRVGDGMVFVCEERERQAVLGPKRGLARGALRAQSPDGGVGFLEGGIVIAECAGLLGAAGRVVGGVEIDNGEVASTFGQAMRLPRVVAELEIGGELSHLRHGAHDLRLAAVAPGGILRAPPAHWAR